MLREYQLLLPTVLNSGLRVPDAVFSVIERRICERFGGYTKASDLQGAWIAPDGEVCRDRLVSYAIAVNSGAEIVSFAHNVGALLSQHSIYLRHPDNSVTIISVRPICPGTASVAQPCPIRLAARSARGTATTGSVRSVIRARG